FSLLPPPPCVRPAEKNFYTLQVLGGCLCVVNDVNGKRLDIWSFKKENSEWAQMFGISCKSDKFIDVYWPISLTSSGKLLLRSNYKALYCYDPPSRELKRLISFNSEMEFAPLPWPLIEAIPHFNSFVSLKALGERSKKIVKAKNIHDYDAISDYIYRCRHENEINY
ncbi:hypothetical protein MKX03_011400, partial [Papaver bracteatum]